MVMFFVTPFAPRFAGQLRMLLSLDFTIPQSLRLEQRVHSLTRPLLFSLLASRC